MTTFEAGDRDVLIYGATSKPNLTAFLARIPAPSITLGFDVFVDDAIAAITMEPCFRVYSVPSSHMKLPADLTASSDSPKPLKPT